MVKLYKTPSSYFLADGCEVRELMIELELENSWDLCDEIKDG